MSSLDKASYFEPTYGQEAPRASNAARAVQEAGRGDHSGAEGNGVSERGQPILTQGDHHTNHVGSNGVSKT